MPWRNKIVLWRNLNGWAHVCKSIRTNKKWIKKNGVVTQDYDIQYRVESKISDEILWA